MANDAVSSPDHQIPWPAPWDEQTAIPMLLADKNDLWVVYYADETRWNERVSEGDGALVAIVHFEGAVEHRWNLEGANAARRQPLRTPGRVPNRAHVIAPSPWLTQWTETLTGPVKEHALASLKHWALVFPELGFECLAVGYSVSATRGTPPDALRQVLDQCWPAQVTTE